VGHLQRNKARDAAARADVFHALDSAALAEVLDRKAGEAGRVLECLVQVNVSDELSKSGVEPAAAHDLVDAADAMPNLRVTGLMTIAAPAAVPGDLDRLVRPQLASLRELRDSYRGPAGLVHLSMGMTDDLEVAAEEGATLVRVGSALFGRRG
jgi:pyridoxal phosphate enzyme (YggS family)